MYQLIDKDGDPIKAQQHDKRPMEFHSEQEAEEVRAHGIRHCFWCSETKVQAVEAEKAA